MTARTLAPERTTRRSGARRPLRLPTFPRGDALLRLGHLLTLSSLLTSGFGAVYWALATRLYGPETVGRNFTAVSALTLLAGVGQVNLANVLVRFVPAAGPRTRRLVLAAYGAALIGSLVLSAAFVLLVPVIIPGLDFLHTPLMGAAFIAGTMVFGLFFVQDGALTGLRKPGWVVGGDLAFAVVKVLALVALAALSVTAAAILVSWIVALTVSVLLVNSYLLVRVLPRQRGAAPADTRSAAQVPSARYIALDYLGDVCWLAAMNVPPLLVLSRLGAAPSAYFSLAWAITQLLYLLSINMGLSLLVDSSRDRGMTALWRVLRHTGILLGLAVLVLGAAAPRILRVFGPGYAQYGTPVFRLMLLSALPNLVYVAAVTVSRAHRRMGTVVVSSALLATLVIGLTAVLLPIMGLTAVGVAWLTAQLVLAAGLLARPATWRPERTASAAVVGRADDDPDPATPRTEPSTPVPDLTLSVLICSFTMRRWDDLSAAIESLSRQHRPPDEIILVIDHCPELVEHAHALRCDDIPITVLPSTGPQGASGARNTGIAAASGEILACLDDDAVAEPDWTERLLAGYANPTVLGVGGLIHARWDTGRPGWFPEEFDWVVGCSYRGVPLHPARVRNFIGANMSFRREALLTMGGFKTELGRVGRSPIGCEETELCIRATQHFPDALLLHEPTAVVSQRVPAERATWAYFRSRCYCEGLSKAALARISGRGPALADERSYLRATIPTGILRALRPGRSHPRAFSALTLMAGVAVTTTGYLAGRMRPARIAELSHGDDGPPGPDTDPERPAAPQNTGPGSNIEPSNPESEPAEPTPEPEHSAPHVEPTEPEPEIDPRPDRRALTIVSWLALPTALALWIAALPRILLAAMTDLGLITVLPGLYWAALAVLLTGFIATLARGVHRIPRGWPLAHVLALIAMIHATPAIVYPTLRYAWAWKSVAITDLLTGSSGTPHVTGAMEAYSGWPGFFTYNALFLRLSGLHSSLSYAAWGPPVFNALMIAPLVLLLRTALKNRRTLWAAVWLFYSTSWIGQDYFSPQAYALVLYLVVLGVVIRAAITADDSRASRVTDLAVVAVLTAAIAGSHQLTPMMLITALLLLSLPRRLRRVALPALAITVFLVAAWDFTAGRVFVMANLGSVINAFGSLDGNAAAGLVGLGAASPGQVFVSYVDRAFTAAVLLLALTSVLLHRRLRRTPLLLLGISPLPWLVATNYGGEIIFRVFMFTLPATACALAVLVCEKPDRLRRAASWSAGTVGRALLLPVLLAGFVISYYGKEQEFYFPRGEVTAVEHLDAIAPPGSTFVVINDNYPDAYTNYPRYTLVEFGDDTPALAKQMLADPIGRLSTIAADAPGPTYLVITRGQLQSAAATGALPAGAITALQRELARDPAHFTVVYQSPDAVITRVTPVAPTITGSGTTAGG